MEILRLSPSPLFALRPLCPSSRSLPLQVAPSPLQVAPSPLQVAPSFLQVTPFFAPSTNRALSWSSSVSFRAGPPGRWFQVNWPTSPSRLGDLLWTPPNPIAGFPLGPSPPNPRQGATGESEFGSDLAYPPPSRPLHYPPFAPWTPLNPIAGFPPRPPPPGALANRRTRCVEESEEEEVDVTEVRVEEKIGPLMYIIIRPRRLVELIFEHTLGTNDLLPSEDIVITLG